MRILYTHLFPQGTVTNWVFPPDASSQFYLVSANE